MRPFIDIKAAHKRAPQIRAAYPARNPMPQAGGSPGLGVDCDAGGAPGRRGHRVVSGGPRDFPVVAFGIGEVRIAALEELRVRLFLRHGGTGLAGAPDEGVDVLRPVHRDDDRAADAAVPGLRRGACVGAELVDAEQCEQGAAQLEDGEAVAVGRVWPAQPAVELTLTREVTHAKGDDVRQWQLLIHGPSLLCRTQTCHPVPDGLGVIMSPCPRRGRACRLAAHHPEPAWRPGSTPAPRDGVARQAHSAAHDRTVWSTFRAGDSYR